jgi:HSP20 family molecular chaperone IbpA
MSSSLLYKPGFIGFEILNDMFRDAVWYDSALKQTTQGYPVADIYESNDGSTLIEFALAGFKKEDLRVEVQSEKRTVTVAASSSSEGAENRRIARRAFTKSYINYDNSLDFAAVTAKFEDGLLTIRLPKRNEEKPKSVVIA